MGEPLLTGNNLACERGYRTLFSEINFSLCSGELLQVSGSNGTGKSTLLKVLAGLSSDYAGEVLFCGEKLSEVREQYYANLCYLAHHKAVKAQLTVLENLTWFAALYPCDDNQIENVLKTLGIYRFRDFLCSQLSAGQQQRVALARLLISKARLWILDEPFTAVDKAGVLQFEAIIEQQKQQGRAIILTTHHSLSLAKPSKILDLEAL